MTIGAFARATGLTPGALRFYSDCSIVEPASTDPSTGYRYYSTEQVENAITIRRLREIGMPLDTIARVMSGDCAAMDQHVDALTADARAARLTAAQLRTQLRLAGDRNMTTVSGPIFATAVDHILTATAQHRDHPVLAGVNIEVAADTITLTATDRYRLSTRTLSKAADPSSTAANEPEWDVVVDGDDLRSILATVRRRHRVNLTVDASGLTFSSGNRDSTGVDAPQRCRILPEEFPDYRGMLAGLPPVVTRIVVSRHALIEALEDTQHEFLALSIEEGRIAVAALHEPESSIVDATVDGPAVDTAFAMTTLYPALASAVGAEVMIDISAPHMPAVIRSADNGDLTTLAMPIDPQAIEPGSTLTV